MPVIKTSTYKRPFLYFNKHIETILPNIVRKVDHISYERERFITVDDDFLDLDWAKVGSKTLLILSHGLEGSADRTYIKGMVRAFNTAGWDALAWNCRSCSGEMNKRARFYHHAETQDLKAVIAHALAAGKYEKIVLTGFSMGGSITLKYLGEEAENLPVQVKAAAVFSVPCDLSCSVRQMALRSNLFYRRRFLRKLEKKIRQKSLMFPEEIKYATFKNIRAFPDFDNKYTAPLHGFKNAEDFYKQASANRYLDKIRIPTLLVNALNDPFLSEECYPIDIAEKSDYVYLEMPKHGGHVGFTKWKSTVNWAEQRALDFVKDYA